MSHKIKIGKDALDYISKLFYREPPLAKDEMYCFIMYDIENDKIRTNIAKYLLRHGCQRIQKSVYLAKMKRKTYTKMHKNLKEINELYDNHDSIIFLPTAESHVDGMKVIGKNVDLEIVRERKNTLFI